MKLAEVKQLLAVGQIQLTKSLGQNFLLDGNQLRRIVRMAEVSPPDRILEIGPGLGHLTEHLVAEAAQVLAIEKDRRLFAWLERRYAAVAHLQLVHADALDYLSSRDWTDWKLVANLPYAVASRLLVDLAQNSHPPCRMVATVQWEVARRLVAQPGNADYGLLALLIQLRYEPAGLFKIPAGCFYPQPDIDSACVNLIRRPQLLLPPVQTLVFEKIIRRCFSQRRKMMFKLLKADWPAECLASAFEKSQLNTQTRAEMVSLGQFIDLTQILAPWEPEQNAT